MVVDFIGGGVRLFVCVCACARVCVLSRFVCFACFVFVYFGFFVCLFVVVVCFYKQNVLSNDVLNTFYTQ